MGPSASIVAMFWVRRMIILMAAAALGGLPADAAHPPTTEKLVERWLSSQTNVLTWSAEAIQTRTFKTLAQPLVSTGRVWITTAPNRFRWELGSPPQTIALRQKDHLMIVYPRFKRLEKYPLKGSGPWKDALALIEASFPKSRSDVESRFQVRSVQETNEIARITLQPRSASARKFVTEIVVGFRVSDATLRSTTMVFSDGSTMRNEFSNVEVNKPLEDKLFDATEFAGFKTVEPAK